MHDDDDSPPSRRTEERRTHYLDIHLGRARCADYYLPAMGALRNTRGRVIANRRAVSREISSACRNKVGGLRRKRPDA